MKKIRISVSVILVVIVTGLFFGPAATTSLGEEIDHEALAQKLVNTCANIKQGDLVVISGGVRDVELLENIAVHVRTLGAFPIVTLGSDRMTRRMYDDVPVEFDSQTPEFSLKMAEIVDAVISVDFNETLGLLKDIPAERMAIRSEAFIPVSDITYERSVRQVSLGNGLYPIAERAKMYGMSLERLAQIFWDGINVDYALLRSIGESVQNSFVGGKEVHITNPNGTDLKVQIGGRPVFISDGVISDKDIKMGGAGCQVWLPAGEVFLTPVPGTAEGKIVVDRQFFQGSEIEKLELTFKAGALTSMTAESGLEPLKAMYDASSAGKEQFSVIDIGINPGVPPIPESKMTAWMTTGMVTVGTGNNIWAGGENNSTYFMACFLPGCTLEIDGKVVVENGSLKK